MLKSSFSFNKIYVIVSDDNSKFAENLYKDIIRIRCEQKSIGHQYFDVNSKEEFKNTLNNIKDECKRNRILPYIHIDCHGSKKGIKLKSTGRLSWNQLSYLLTDINIACKNNLFISMSSCYGGYIALSVLNRMTKGGKPRAPVYGLVGPSSEVSYGNLEKGFVEYFNSLLSIGNFDQALKLLNIHAKIKDKLIFNTCDSIFKMFIENFLSKEIVKKFDSKIKFTTYIHTLAKDYFYHTGKYPNTADYNLLTNLILSESFYIDFLNAIRNDFFLIDLYPENKYRFEKISKLNNWNHLIAKVLK